MPRLRAGRGRGERCLCNGRAVRVEPLALTPGRFVLTDKAVYFRAFCLGRDEPEQVIELSEVFRAARRRHHLQDAAVELAAKGKGAQLFRVGTEADCAIVWRHLEAARGAPARAEHEWEQIARAWHQGSVSTYHYLLHLNLMAHRSFSDLAQYPVFPWVVADYVSPELDLSRPESFRDLARPIGALNEDRLARSPPPGPAVRPPPGAAKTRKQRQEGRDASG